MCIKWSTYHLFRLIITHDGEFYLGRVTVVAHWPVKLTEMVRTDGFWLVLLPGEDLAVRPLVTQVFTAESATSENGSSVRSERTKY